MTKISDKIKIEVELGAVDALRSMVVLGRTNGNGSGALWKALRDKLDPKQLFNSRQSASMIGIVDYRSVENDVIQHFFGLYAEHDKKAKREEITSLKQEVDKLQSQISKLKNELGEF